MPHETSGTSVPGSAVPQMDTARVSVGGWMAELGGLCPATRCCSAVERAKADSRHHAGEPQNRDAERSQADAEGHGM